MRGLGLEALTSLRSLTLSLDHARPDQVMKRVASLTGLTALTFEECHVLTGHCFAQLTALTALVRLKLHQCSGFTTAGMLNLSFLKSLEELELGGNEFHEPLALEALQGLASLRRLGLQDAHVLPLPEGQLYLPALESINVIWTTLDCETDDEFILDIFSPEPERLRALAIDCCDAYCTRCESFWDTQLGALTALTLVGCAKEGAVAQITHEISWSLPLLQCVVLHGFPSATNDDIARLTALRDLRRLIISDCPQVTLAVELSFAARPITIIFHDASCCRDAVQ